MAECFVGEIRLLGFNFAPQGWAVCDGQTMPISQNQALYSLLGTTYGGDGISTFKLPDLRGRVPMHVAQASPIGQAGGNPTVTLTVSNMPAHTHTVNASSAAGAAGTPANNYPAVDAVTPNTTHVMNYGATANATMNPGMIGPAGGNTPVSVLQPYLSVTFVIALNGLYPVRS
jgi:microcystin-dependent protein